MANSIFILEEPPNFRSDCTESRWLKTLALKRTNLHDIGSTGIEVVEIGVLSLGSI
jgi:hypothetical protein